MANTCAICGAEINVFQSQKLTDGNYICRKTCKKKGFKDYDFVHSDLPGVEAHLAQVELGTKLWNTYFVPRLKTKDKSQKLEVFYPVYVAADVGLMAYVETRYKIFIFGKSQLACVYRIADLVGYDYSTETTQNSEGKTENVNYATLTFRNTEGLNPVKIKVSGPKSFEKMEKYFNTLFGIQKTLGNVKNTWKSQINAAASIGSAIGAMMKGDQAALEDKAAVAAEALDTAIYGDRTELEQKADAAIAAVK